MTKKSLFISISLLVILQFVLIFPDKIGICSFINNQNCLYGFFDSIYRDSLFNMSLAVLIVSFFTFFISEQVFRIWLKFTYVWISLSIISIFLTPESTGSIFNLDKEFVAIILSSLFVIISLLLITITSIITHQKSQKS